MSCRQNSVTTRRLRRLFGKPRGFASCALVGSSGTLLRHNFGAEIDAHEFVIRANLAPIAGYETHVGRKVSLRTMVTEALGCALLERSCPALRRGDRSWCPPYGIFINSAESFGAAITRGCGNRTGPIFGWDELDRPSDATLRRFSSRKHNIMTGPHAIAIAMHLCPNGTTLYGFSGDRISVDAPPSPYHYYDSNSPLQRDDLPDTALRVSKFLSDEPECVRVPKTGTEPSATPTGLHAPLDKPVAAPGLRRSAVDPFVDGLRHPFEYEAYAFNVPPHFLREPVLSCPRPRPGPPMIWEAADVTAGAAGSEATHLTQRIARLSPVAMVEVAGWSSAATSSCQAAAAQLLNAGAAEAPLLLLAFVSHIDASLRLLRTTAAAHGLPLALVTPVHVGQTGRSPASRVGSRSSWARADKAFELTTLRRALQLIGSLPRLSTLPIVLLDADNAFVANAPSAAMLARLAQLSGSEVIVGGQCTIEPNCDGDTVNKLRQLPAYGKCRADGYRACAPNADVLLGRPSALARLLGAALHRAAADRGYHNVLRSVEGGALLKMYSDGDDPHLRDDRSGGGSEERAGSTLRVDKEGTFFLSLKKCFWPSNYSKNLRGLEACREVYFNPLATLLMPNSTSLIHWPIGKPAISGRCRAASCSVARPLIVQAAPWGLAGMPGGSDFNHRKLAPLLEAYREGSHREHSSPRHGRFPVLLIDPARNGSLGVDAACVLLTRCPNLANRMCSTLPVTVGVHPSAE